MTGNISADDFVSINVAIFDVMGALFDMLDSVYIAGFSLLDIFIALEFLAVTVWFIMEFISIRQGGS